MTIQELQELYVCITPPLSVEQTQTVNVEKEKFSWQKAVVIMLVALLAAIILSNTFDYIFNVWLK